MGCHTWFYNKISEMPNEHLEELKKKVAKHCRDAYIVKCTYEEWVKDIQDDLKRYVDKEYLSDDDKFWVDYFKKAETREYYDKTRKKYIKEAETLENPKTPKKRALKIITKHETLFDKNLENGYYDLSDFGWGDNYRVYGYPDGNFKSTEEAIKFLEEYDDGSNITYGSKNGMCDEIREIINDFFKEYPKGYIDYG